MICCICKTIIAAEELTDSPPHCQECGRAFCRECVVNQEDGLRTACGHSICRWCTGWHETFSEDNSICPDQVRDGYEYCPICTEETWV